MIYNDNHLYNQSIARFTRDNRFWNEDKTENVEWKRGKKVKEKRIEK